MWFARLSPAGPVVRGLITASMVVVEEELQQIDLRISEVGNVVTVPDNLLIVVQA